MVSVKKKKTPLHLRKGKDCGFEMLFLYVLNKCQLLSVSKQEGTLSLTFTEGCERLKKKINESVVTKLSEKLPMSLGGIFEVSFPFSVVAKSCEEFFTNH